MNEAEDVACPKCEARIGQPCVNSDGGPLGYGGRTVRGYHPARWDALVRFVSAMDTWGQGQLKAALRETADHILGWTTMRPRTALERAAKERALAAWRRRYSALWIRLQPRNRPLVERRLPVTEKASVPHPELIDCPVCNTPKGEKCPGVTEGYHLKRIRVSP
jgi:hypothetical protein